jgi:fused signal recognition particle receptor
MFEFLKNKLKGALSVFSRKVEEEIVEKEELPPKEEKKEKKPEKKESPKKEEKQKSRKEEKQTEKKEDKKEKKEEHFEKKKEAPKKKEEKKAVPEKEAEEKYQEEEKEEKKYKEEHKKEQEEKEEHKIEQKEFHISEEPAEQAVKEEAPAEEKKEEKKSLFRKLFSFKKTAPEEKSEEKKEEAEIPAEEERAAEEKTAEPEPEEDAEKRTVFGKISDAFTKRVLSKEQFETLFWELEVVLMENNVAVEVIDKIKADLEQEIVGKPLSKSGIQNTIESSLKKSIESLFDVPQIDIISKAKGKKPLVVLFLGINGSGKTTSIAKVASLLKANGLSSVMAAGDTFRAAAIDQLEKHANNLGIKIIKHQYGADAAAVAFDAVKYAEAHRIDVVLIDTAGRMHSNANLMDELKKIVRVSKPDMKIFVGEAITGNDCVEQARSFNTAVGIDGIILAKADVDEKGGAAISISYVTRKPILYLGTGQNYSDLTKFDSKKIIESIGL